MANLSDLANKSLSSTNQLQLSATDVQTDSKAGVAVRQPQPIVEPVEDLDFVLILQEQRMHPEPCIRDIIDAFEPLSILRIYDGKGLERIKSAPIFDERYLVLFETKRGFKDSITYINFSTMFPVILCDTPTQVDEIKEMCVASKLSYRIYHHQYLKEDAYAQIAELAGYEPSVSFCETLIRTTGLNPTRVVSGMAALAGKKLTAKNVTKYVDKYVYVSAVDVVMGLLQMFKSKRHCQRTVEYLVKNRNWYNKYVKQSVVDIVNQLVDVSTAMLSGEITSQNMLTYAEEHHISRRQMMFADNVFRSVSLVELLALKSFVERASIMEVALKLC